MSGRRDGSKERSQAARRKMRAAGAAVTTATGASRRRKPQPPPSAGNTKKIILGIGVVILIAAIVSVVMVVLGGSDDFEISQSQFSGDIQLEENEDGFIQWSDDFNNPDSEKSKELKQSIKEKLSGALEAEGISVDDVKITSLTKAAPVTITRNELIDDQTGRLAIRGRANGVDAIKTKPVTYTGVSFVNLKYETFGKPSKNAATFGSADEKAWGKIGKVVKSRLASTGLQTSMKSFSPKPSFTESVKRAVSNHAYSVTAPSPVAQDSVACDCSTRVYNVITVEKPTTVCNCDSGCVGENTTIYGGVDNVFYMGSKICPSAYYVDIIDEMGGYVEIIFAAKADVSPGPDKPIEGFTYHKQKMHIAAATLKALGAVIKPTLPPTTADPDIGGFFAVKTTTANPYVKHPPQNPLPEDTEPPPILITLHITKVDGEPLKYRSAFVDTDGEEVGQLMDQLNDDVKNALGGLEIQDMMTTISRVDVHGSGMGMVIELSLRTSIENAVQDVYTVEKKGQPIRDVMARAMASVGELLSMRFSEKLLIALQTEDKHARQRRALYDTRRVAFQKKLKIRTALKKLAGKH